MPYFKSVLGIICGSTVSWDDIQVYLLQWQVLLVN